MDGSRGSRSEKEPAKHSFKSESLSLGGTEEQTTSLVGFAVCESPHERLRILYTKILDVLEQIPKNAAYRKYTEQITNEKLSMVKAEPDVKKLEDQLQCGQLEEVILQRERSQVGREAGRERGGSSAVELKTTEIDMLSISTCYEK
ncbi:NADH dehydrogenase [ubiquinone] 1 alpha subcomplex subunit 5-like [Lutra lutra]|uniref:NADH dehydrogenase [ubiquinone] 1 alpha subcomplex subunit 5-like n=1 Tax=Lutra lutra TaxID=9657 RepID=UPI001FD171BA|nr:NADH dehydrogenase [ubiquinone] 1 alpha subcomplex subunit 5-like [Lutra lutra]